MYIKLKKESLFTALMESEEVASLYFYNDDLTTYNKKRFDELKKELLHERIVWAVINNMPNSKSTKDQANKRLLKAKDDFERFNNCLAYLVMSGKFSLELCQSLGFDNEFINKLLDLYTNDNYDEYYYNEETRNTILVRDGRSYVLDYTPDEVLKKIYLNNKKDSNGGEFRRINVLM